MIGQLRAAHHHRFELPLVSEPWRSNPARFHGSLRARPPAWRRMLDDLDHAIVLDARTPSWRCRSRWRSTGSSSLRKDGVRLRPAPRGGGRGGVIVANPVTAVLRELGLAGTRSEHEVRSAGLSIASTAVKFGRAVLQGLLDTDGGPVTQSRRTCRVQYTTTSPQLRDDVAVPRRVRSAASPTPAPGRPRVDGLAVRTVGPWAIAPMPSSSISVSPQGRAVPARRGRPALCGVRWWRPTDAFHRSHRARGRGRDGLHPGCGAGLPLRDRRLSRHPQHPE